MKIRNFVVVFMLSCIVNQLTAEQVWLKSEYPTPVTVYLNGNPIKTFPKDDKTSFQLLRWGDNITFKVGSNPVPYYLAFKKEVQKIANAFKQNPNFVATITIRNTGNKLDFDYDTNIQFAPTRTPSNPALQAKLNLAAKFLNEKINVIEYINQIPAIVLLETAILEKQGKFKYSYGFPHPRNSLVSWVLDAQRDWLSLRGINCPSNKTDAPEKQLLDRVICVINKTYNDLLILIKDGKVPGFPEDV